jgi:hypothetical protein
VRTKPLLQLIQHLCRFAPQGQQSHQPLAFRRGKGQGRQGQRVELGEGRAHWSLVGRCQLAQQGTEHAVVAHQQGGLVLRPQPEGGAGGQQQVHQLGVGGGGGNAEQFDAALQLLTHPLAPRLTDGAAEGAAAGPEAQGPRPVGHARAGGAGDRSGELGPQAEGLIRHQPHQLPLLDRPTRLEGVEQLDRGGRHLLIAPEPVDLRQGVAQASVAVHLPGVEVADAGGGLQGHGRGGWGGGTGGPILWSAAQEDHQGDAASSSGAP